MNSIKIDTGEIRLAVNDDPSRVIEFNPNDIVFVERFYALIRELEEAQERYATRAKEIDASKAVDQYGIPINVAERLAFLRETCEYFRAKVDDLFGAGTAQKAFGDALVLEVFEQFFAGITPFIQSAREDKIVRYTANQKLSGRVMKA